ncbi:MAG: hypothetical protein QXL17_07340 [Candidatus Thermoplasmatota archaeon]
MDITYYGSKYDDSLLQLYYRSIFHERKEFDNVRLPTWHHRYSLEENSYQCLAFIDDQLVGSLGIITYDGYIQGKKQKIGFFVDNCVDPDFSNIYNDIMFQLFLNIERQAKKDGVAVIFGWDYIVNADKHDALFSSMGYKRIDGINWFGGGTKPVLCFPVNNFKMKAYWKIGLWIFSLKHYLKEFFFKTPSDVLIRKLESEDIPSVVKIINEYNKDLIFSPRYTEQSLKQQIKKYNIEGIVAVIHNEIVGVVLPFFGPWSGWMYNKPFYSKRYGILIIKHPLEFVVKKEYIDQIAPKLIFEAMKDEHQGKYVLFVEIADRRNSWVKQAFEKTGGSEFIPDLGTLFIKNLSSEKIDLSKPIYVPTNLVISPYTEKI